MSHLKLETDLGTISEFHEILLPWQQGLTEKAKKCLHPSNADKKVKDEDERSIWY